MNNKLQILLFDVSPFIYIGYFGAMYILKDPTSQADSQKVISITENLVKKKVKECLTLYDDRTILPIFVYDGYPAWKKQISTEYKQQRTQTVTKEIKDAIINGLKVFPGYHVINRDQEADDIIATIKHKINSQAKEFFTNFTSYEFTIFSKDNDLLQLCDFRTILYDPANNKGRRDRNYMFEKFNGITNFKHVILHKICFGDSSDNIVGIFKGKKKKPIIQQFENCKKFTEFLHLPIIKPYKQQAIDLFNIIRLKHDLPYEIVGMHDNNQMLDFDITTFSVNKGLL